MMPFPGAGGPDPQALAALHARCFAQGWSAAEIAGLLRRPEVVALTSPVASPDGFALVRTAAGEAELLTLAVVPEARRRGLGAALLARALATAAARHATEMFLEVAADNSAALALYRRAGFEQVGQRRGYYRDCADGLVDALVLRCPLEAQTL